MEVTRRQLPLAAFQELRVAIGETRGVPGHRLDDLERAPEQLLLALVPAHAGPVTLAGGHVCAALGSRTVPLFPATDQLALDIFNACDGTRDLRAVTELVAGRRAAGFEETFPRVRQLFLQLVRANVLRPANAGVPMGEAPR